MWMLQFFHWSSCYQSILSSSLTANEKTQQGRFWAGRIHLNRLQITSLFSLSNLSLDVQELTFQLVYHRRAHLCLKLERHPYLKAPPCPHTMLNSAENLAGPPGSADAKTGYLWVADSLTRLRKWDTPLPKTSYLNCQLAAGCFICLYGFSGKFENRHGAIPRMS